MKPRVTMITLAVNDLERAVRFYRDGLGFPSPGIIGTEFAHGAVAFFDLQPGLKLAVWPRASLSHDSGLPIGDPDPTGMCLAHNVASKQEVDVVMARAKRAGAHITKPAVAHLLGRLRGVFPGPRWPPLGNRMEPGTAAGRLAPDSRATTKAPISIRVAGMNVGPLRKVSR